MRNLILILFSITCFSQEIGVVYPSFFPEISLTYEIKNFEKEANELKLYLLEAEKNFKKQSPLVKIEENYTEELFFEINFSYKMYIHRNEKMANFIINLYKYKIFNSINNTSVTYLIASSITNSSNLDEDLKHFMKNWEKQSNKISESYILAMMAIDLHKSNNISDFKVKYIRRLIQGINKKIKNLNSQNKFEVNEIIIYKALLCNLYYALFLNNPKTVYIENAALFAESLMKLNHHTHLNAILMKFSNDCNFYYQIFLDHLKSLNEDHPKKDFYKQKLK